VAENRWQTLAPHLQSEMRFQLALLVAHRQIYDRHFSQEPTANHAIGFHLHGYRRRGDWYIVLALTPWMFARLLFAETPPAIQIPDGWRAGQRQEDDYQLLGPMVEPLPETGGIKSHLNYHPTLGHYLLQPIALDMRQYANAIEAFEAWNRVIRTRDENMRRLDKECAWQQEISRRELFGRYL
jgi:hypothetical protein